MWLWGLVTVWGLVRVVWGSVAPPPDRPFAAAVSVDLNRAGIPALMALPGIGRGRARAIVLHRVRHGPFRRVEELSEVDGFGGKAVARIRPFLRPIRGP